MRASIVWTVLRREWYETVRNRLLMSTILLPPIALTLFRSPEAKLDVVAAWMLVRGLDIPADIVPCTRSEFEEEKHEIDTLARAAFLRGRRVYERRA